METSKPKNQIPTGPPAFMNMYKDVRHWLFRADSNHVIAVATVVAAIAAVFYTCYANGQLKTMARQLKQMESQTRPWVGLDAANHPVRTTSLTFDKDGAGRLNCFVNVKNFGGYPAQNTIPTCDLVITQTTTSVTAKEREMCSGAMPSFGGAVIFSQGTQPQEWQLVVPKSNMATNPNGAQSTFQAYIVGCIQYSDQFEKPHYTAFAYRLQAPNSMFGLVFEPIPNTTIPQGEWVAWDGFVDRPESDTKGDHTHQ